MDSNTTTRDNNTPNQDNCVERDERGCTLRKRTEPRSRKQRNQMQKRSTGNDNNATKRNAGRGVRFQSQRRSVCTTKDKAGTASSPATKSQSVSSNTKYQRRGRQQRAYPPSKHIYKSLLQRQKKCAAHGSKREQRSGSRK